MSLAFGSTLGWEEEVVNGKGERGQNGEVTAPLWSALLLTIGLPLSVGRPISEESLLLIPGSRVSVSEGVCSYFFFTSDKYVEAGEVCLGGHQVWRAVEHGPDLCPSPLAVQ